MSTLKKKENFLIYQEILFLDYLNLMTLIIEASHSRVKALPRAAYRPAQFFLWAFSFLMAQS